MIRRNFEFPRCPRNCGKMELSLWENLWVCRVCGKVNNTNFGGRRDVN